MEKDNKRISAVLDHNPYLLQTNVSFNGHKPRINCQVEKYASLPLKDWVHLVPEIFYQEMNGYDFDLDFFGTETDFQEVCEAFKKAKVSVGDNAEDKVEDEKGKVRISLKNELEDSKRKSDEVDDLILWLDENRNCRFDFDLFKEENADLLEGYYPYFVVGGDISPDLEYISVESISDVGKELNGVVLNNTPILFLITGDNYADFRKNLVVLLSRKDIGREQLFFIVHPSMNAEQVERVIYDLGVKEPQIVKQADDEIIKKFIQNYPITDYIRKTIALLHGITDEIRKKLSEENRKSAETNKEVHDRIDSLEKEIDLSKKADESFLEHDNYTASADFRIKLNGLENQIMSWKNHKSKITGDTEAVQAAGEYVKFISRQISTFAEAIGECAAADLRGIQNSFDILYRACGDGSGYVPELPVPERIPLFTLPDLEGEFLKLKEVTAAESKNDFQHLFLRNPSANGAPVQTVTYFLDQWRSAARAQVVSLAKSYTDAVIALISRYYLDLAGAYHVHLSETILQKTAEKEKESMKLSDEERLLQDDNNWLAQFSDRLGHIERG